MFTIMKTGSYEWPLLLYSFHWKSNDSENPGWWVVTCLMMTEMAVPVKYWHWIHSIMLDKLVAYYKSRVTHLCDCLISCSSKWHLNTQCKFNISIQNVGEQLIFCVHVATAMALSFPLHNLTTWLHDFTSSIWSQGKWPQNVSYDSLIKS